MGGLGGYLFYSGWSPNAWDTQQTIQLPSEANCFVHERTCSTTGSPIQLNLSLSPQPVPLMQAVQANLTFKGLSSVQAVALHIEGVNMFMGKQIAQLTPMQANTWQGHFTLPICSESQMQWRVIVFVQAKQQSYQTVFYFNTYR